MAQTQQPKDELQEIIDLFARGSVAPHLVGTAILTLARRLKALEDREKTRSSPDT